MSATIKQIGSAEAATSMPSHVQSKSLTGSNMNIATHITSTDVRSIDLEKLIKHRDELYHVVALCEALHQAMEGVKVANGLPELLLTIENNIDAAAEQIHLMTFADPAGRAS